MMCRVDLGCPSHVALVGVNQNTPPGFIRKCVVFSALIVDVVAAARIEKEAEAVRLAHGVEVSVALTETVGKVLVYPAVIR